MYKRKVTLIFNIVGEELAEGTKLYFPDTLPLETGMSDEAHIINLTEIERRGNTVVMEGELETDNIQLFIMFAGIFEAEIEYAGVAQ